MAGFSVLHQMIGVVAVDTTIFAELRRLGRNMLETLNVINELSENGVQFVFAHQPEVDVLHQHCGRNQEVSDFCRGIHAELYYRVDGPTAYACCAFVCIPS